MKKTITIVTLLAGAASSYAQGTVNFSNYIPSSYVQRMYDYSAADIDNTTVTYNGYTVRELVGSTSSGTTPKETPVGTTVYAGAPLAGTGFDAQLLAAAGANDNLSQLAPIGAPVNFWTSPSSLVGLFRTTGLGLPVSTTTPSIPDTGVNGAATVAVAVWNNGGGLFNTLADAQAAGEPWGISPLESMSRTGGGAVQPSNLFGTVGVTYQGLASSFSLGLTVPEPDVFGLGLLGAAALFLRRQHFGSV